MAAFKGTSGADSFIAADGDNSYDGLGGTDTITFNFRLTDATVSYVGNKVIVDSATSHTVLTGFQVYRFTDGTVDETVGSGLVSALYYYSQYMMSGRRIKMPRRTTTRSGGRRAATRMRSSTPITISRKIRM